MITCRRILFATIALGAGTAIAQPTSSSNSSSDQPADSKAQPTGDPNNMPGEPAPAPLSPDATTPTATTPTTDTTMQTNTTTTTMADPNAGMQPQQSQVTVTDTGSRGGTWDYMDNPGFTLAIGGGVEGFTSQSMRNTTSVGGDWFVRAGLGTNMYVGLELSYIGSAQGINALGLDSNAILLSNGAQAAIRINATRNLAAQPFIFGGGAWRRYSLTNENFNTSDIRSSDDVFEIPMGLGIAGKAKGFTVDARGEFRLAYNNNLAPDNLTTRTGNADLHRWGANVNVGYEF